MKYLGFIFLIVSFSCHSQRIQKSISNITEEDIFLSLELHNKARKFVGTPPLSWSIDLADDAQKYAEVLASRNGRLIHSHYRDNQGENLYKVFAIGGILEEAPTFPGRDASKSWFDEIKFYRYAKIRRFRFGPAIGHYTQMIWKSTTHLGIGWAVSSTGAVFVVARYSPAGNYIGERPY
ncbi:CAP family protein [Crocinitomicaceae bacterium]|nr:CAP family protein [Crocinitomicaceae bacterium]MDB4606298.1 CAP family protein [Crocinitomicaceae bacterium]